MRAPLRRAGAIDIPRPSFAKCREIVDFKILLVAVLFAGCAGHATSDNPSADDSQATPSGVEGRADAQDPAQAVANNGTIYEDEFAASSGNGSFSFEVLDPGKPMAWIFEFDTPAYDQNLPVERYPCRIGYGAFGAGHDESIVGFFLDLPPDHQIHDDVIYDDPGFQVGQARAPSPRPYLADNTWSMPRSSDVWLNPAGPMTLTVAGWVSPAEDGQPGFSLELTCEGWNGHTTVMETDRVVFFSETESDDGISASSSAGVSQTHQATFGRPMSGRAEIRVYVFEYPTYAPPEVVDTGTAKLDTPLGPQEYTFVVGDGGMGDQWGFSGPPGDYTLTIDHTSSNGKVFGFFADF